MKLSHLTLLASVLAAALTGCTLSTTATPMADPGLGIRGSLHGGQAPIVGAHIYLLAANTTGYGGAGIAPSAANASVSLLQLASTGLSDPIGAYVLTDAHGNWTITGDYACVPNTQVYLYALGGNPGAGTNTAAGLMALLGNCPAAGNFAAATPFVWINEVSTIAAAYAFAGFATDATHVSSSGTPLAQTGIANAFANASNLAGLATGAALTSTPSGNATVPQAEINTLANILAACVNSTGPGSANCSTLFANAKSTGSTGSVATDTATAAINIAHNPAANVANLYLIPPPTIAFAPALTTQPMEFSIGLSISGGGVDVPANLAVDASGNVWVVNNVNSITEYASSSAPISPSAGGPYGIGGYTSVVKGPFAVAIDGAGNPWITSPTYNTITRLTPAGGLTASYPTTGFNRPFHIAFDAAGNIWSEESYSGAGGVLKMSTSGAILGVFTGGGTNTSAGLALDTLGNAWVANDFYPGSVTELSNAGVPAAGTPLLTGNLDYPHAIAVDGANNVWVPNYYNTITEYSNAGAVLSGANGFSGGGLNDPYGIAFDGAGNAFIVNASTYGSSISEFSGTGTAITGSGGGYAINLLTGATALALDGSGNVWVANTSGNNIVELIGLSAPVVTPAATAIKNGALGARP